MGLQSAMTTALTGLQAAEATIDIVGNNVANSNTIGFKESSVLFATQFLQTQSIGSIPSDARGGTNPRQIGLGVKVSSINPNFTQGTIEISANPLDVAIQGDGFLMVQGSSGETLFSRNGQLQTNAHNEVVTATGNRVLGFTVDENFNMIEQMTTLRIPLGEEVVAQATRNAFMSGRLSPEAAEGTQPAVILSEVLGDSTLAFPTGAGFDLNNFNVLQPPTVPTAPPTPIAGGSLNVGSEYAYRLAFVQDGHEGPPTAAFGQTTITTAGQQTIPLTGLPEATGDWDGRRLYRSVDGGAFELIDTLPATGTTTYDDEGILPPGAVIDAQSLDVGNYGYYVTWVGPNAESRPTPLVGTFSISETNRRISIQDLPQPPPGSTDFDSIRIYRNTGSGGTDYYEVATLPASETFFIDNRTNADIISGNQLNLMGPLANQGTRLVNLVSRDGANYTNVFEEGVLTFTGTKGIRDVAAKQLTITANTTVSDLIAFMDQAWGIDSTADSANAGGTINNATGRIEFRSNLGIENALSVKLAAFHLTPAGSTTAKATSIHFSQSQSADGPGTTTDFIVFDSLGIPLTVRLTTVLEAKDGESTTYRWYATSPNNEPDSDPANVDTMLGSGTIVFDGNGNITAGERASIAIARRITASESPLEFTIDFTQVSGLSEQGGTSALNLKLQDGFSAGTLTSFIITESGLIRGVYSNGAERPLGQIRMAKFANNAGLQQVGENMFITGVNSGEPIVGNPGERGIGTLTAGAVELSNTDIGQNLIKLILSSTQYRGGTRVITAAQELLDELMALRR